MTLQADSREVAPERLLDKVNNQRLGMVPWLGYHVNLVFSHLAFRIVSMADEYRQNAEAIRNLNRDLDNEGLLRSGYKDQYTNENELAVWHRYRTVFESENAAESEVVYRATTVRDQILAVAAGDPYIRNVVNFGCSYGWLENEIATRLSTTTVWGLDRSPDCIRLNEDQFGNSNCHFVATDIFDFITENPRALTNSVLCHINVGVYFLPTFIEKLYRFAASAGVRYVVCFEPSGLSRQTHRYFPYSLEATKNQVSRGVMLLNNYPGIMRSCGFDLVLAETFQPPHPHADFRSVMFVGRRTG